jgi:CheY-like chemotaxis protein
VQTKAIGNQRGERVLPELEVVRCTSYLAFYQKGLECPGGERMGREQPRRWAGPVLVVEDDPDLRELIQCVLEGEGIAVETATDGQAAIERVERCHPSLVLLDRELPILDGVAVAARLYATYGESIRILAMTAASTAAEFGREVRAIDYLQKPFDLDNLIAMVRRLVAPEPTSDELLVG